MTAQVPDRVLFEESSFAMTAVDGSGLFDPATHGLSPRPISTACWRGYVCTYTIVERQLVLRDLELGSDGEPPRLAGSTPRHEDPAWRYERLDIPVAFTGRLLMGRGDIAGRPYLNMGFWPAWMYREVRELTLQAGALFTAVDCSRELAEVRADIAAVAARPAGEPTHDWISRTISLAYDYSWPGRQ
jgi:hypothetical protein